MKGTYRVDQPRAGRLSKRWLSIVVVAILFLATGYAVYKLFVPTPAEKAVSQLRFDNSVSNTEKQSILEAIHKQPQSPHGIVTASIKTAFETDKNTSVLDAYVPVTNVYATRQTLTKSELAQMSVYVPSSIDEKTRGAIANLLELKNKDLVKLADPLAEIQDTAVAFVPVSQLSPSVKLLTFEGAYYLDSFQKGAVFRQAVFSGDQAARLDGLQLNNLPTKNATLKVNMTGVTALTRLMMKKLNSVHDPTYFSKQIGTFLADADITHVSNEVSFKDDCGYSNAVFCAPPQMIDVLKSSGVDLVELTGNHNNDSGKQYNTESIKLYHSLGWHTFGGGLNTAEAAKPYVADKKHSKITFLGYNYADSPNGGPIATSLTAGANSFDFDKIKADIKKAKQQSSFVIVDVQFWECFAYPNGYVEFPECDQPITDQAEVFRKITDLGADMVIGTQAHQPQTYELYKGKPIYYGLGNLYFEQTQWPGTERGIILTHYFSKGKLLQTKLSPTVYDQDLQTHLMTNDEAAALLQRLQTARQTAGL